MNETSTAAVIFPESLGILGDLGVVLSCSMLIAALARVVIPLPFSPVPVSGQTLGALLAGLLLGSRRGAASVISYVLLGISGVPVFALGAGPAYLLGPTGGFLLGFIGAAFVAGAIAEQPWGRNLAGTLLALVAGSLVIYACGLAWLVKFTGPSRVLRLGLYPFLPGDIIKLVIATAVARLGLHARSRHWPLNL